jgi:DNA polymerase-1
MAYEAGAAVDPLSWKDMWVKFEKAGGKVTCWTKTKEEKGKQKTQQYTDDFEASSKRPNWNAAALMSYLKVYREQDERVYRYLLSYREAMLNNRIKSTYFDAYLQMCDFKNVLHGQFVQTGTLTGRLSSRKPNLQNLAKPGGTADQKAHEKFMGEKDEDAINRLVRSLFIARPGHALVSCDFSQIEYRAAAWYSQDKEMIAKWIADPRIDYHQATMELLGLDRDLCKTINFGTLYGMSATGLAATLTAMGRPTTKAQAQEILNLLWEKRPALKELINTIGAEARRCNYIQNAYGRVVDVPIGREYVALNYLVQGHCGDQMREALVRLYWMIQANGWDVKMLLTVHDEILFEIPIALVAELAPKLAAEMCKCNFMGVPVLSDIEVGTDWGTMVSLTDWNAARAA